MLLRLLTAASIAGISLVSASRSPKQCAPRNTEGQLFRSRRTCAILTGLEPDPDVQKWTHKPYCRSGKDPNGDGSMKFCVYTRSNEQSGRGVSIITTPKIAEAMSLRTSFHVYDDLNDLSERSSYEWQQLPGRGIGLVATRDIKAGTVIFRDLPALVVERNAKDWLRPTDRVKLLWRSLLQLPEAEQKRLRALAISGGIDLVEDILRTDGVGFVLKAEEENAAVLPELSRINHSCLPNAFYRTDARTMELELYALHDIKAGEELTISYTSTEFPSGIRQSFLKEQWFFDCKCQKCTAPKKDIEASDQRLMTIRSMQMRAQQEGGLDSAEQRFDFNSRLVDLYDQEGLFAPTAERVENAAIAASELGDLENAKAYGEEAAARWEIVGGRDSPEFARMVEFAQDPTKHPSWKIGSAKS